MSGSGEGRSSAVCSQATARGRNDRPSPTISTARRNTEPLYSLTIHQDTMERPMGGELVVFVLAAATFAGYVFGSDALKTDTRP
ncbi:hypothetical protein EKPJFOCH_2259 [Methylobacterium thuringiense]|uniref:Uncharacterized protein n=1 Tax=Methylobacterium thuringiense TaxID=1003091 RepID=A0ABQ4TLM3_9HYPH|nr:hypothetical protein EKPJFOCH_2259 [Methylobacterium thuringiense]